MKKLFRLKKRGRTFYYMLPWETCFHTTGCTRQRDAEHFAMEILKQGPEAHSKTLFKDYVEKFFVWDQCSWIKSNHEKGRSFSKSSASWRRGHVTNYLLPILGKRTLSEISANTIDDLLLNLQVANGTKNKILDTASIIFEKACRDGIIEKSPTSHITRFSEKKKIRDIFDKEELFTLFPDDFKEISRIWKTFSNAAFFATLAHTGIRAGECRVLEWNDIHFDKNLITISKALKNDGSIGTTKNGKTREVFITNKLGVILLKQKEDSYNSFVFPKMMTKLSDRNFYGRIFKSALSNSGINKKDRNLVPHSFRHTFNTLLRNELGDDSAVRKLLGHQTPEMTDNYYNPTLNETARFLSGYSKRINSAFNDDKDSNKSAR